MVYIPINIYKHRVEKKEFKYFKDYFIDNGLRLF